MERCNKRLAAELAERRAALAAMRVPDRIRTAVRLRLEMLVPVIGTDLQWGSRVKNSPKCDCAWCACSECWRCCLIGRWRQVHCLGLRMHLEGLENITLI